MSIDILGVYECKIKQNYFKLIRDESDLYAGSLYVNGKLAGRVPFYYTINKMIVLEDKCYPTYKM